MRNVAVADVEYVPPDVWVWDRINGGTFANVNRPTAGATAEKVLPVGKHPFQLYSLGTANGRKVTIMFEELLAKGHSNAEYDAWFIDIENGDQFGSGFVALNPNSKIPVLEDRSGPDYFRVFESAAILVHLAEKFGEFLPTEPVARAECMSWLMWQVGAAPSIGGGYGHFFHHAPVRIEYAINRYAIETKRLFDVLNNQLARTRYLAGQEFTIADIAAYTWFGNLWRGDNYGNNREFLGLHEYRVPRQHQWHRFEVVI